MFEEAKLIEESIASGTRHTFALDFENLKKKDDFK